MSIINIKEALEQLNGKEKLYRSLVAGFCDKYVYIDKDIKTDLVNHEYQEARRAAHTLKGLGGNLGATGLHLKAKELEHSIKELVTREDREEYVEKILAEEWTGFSDMLAKTVYELHKILDCEYGKLDSVATSDELKDLENIVDDNNIEFANIVSEDVDTNLQMLVRSLSTYNYETVSRSLSLVDEGIMSRCLDFHWTKVKEHILNYEYDLAKNEIIEGIRDEK